MDKNIAVLIPTFKPQKYLKNCLDSLDAQTLCRGKFCVYIALNGDRHPYENEVLSLLRTYRFKSKYIYIDKTGVSNARNKLIDSSEEDFITFIDDDDLVSPDYLSNLLEVSTVEYVGIAKVYNFKKSLDNVTNTPIGRLYEKLPPSEMSKVKAWRFNLLVWGKVIHRDIIGKTRFNLKLKILEDSLFCMNISKNIKGFKKPKKDVYYYYLNREESASRKRVSLIWRAKNDIYFISKSIKSLISPQHDRLFVLVIISYVVVHFFRLVWKRILKVKI